MTYLSENEIFWDLFFSHCFVFCRKCLHETFNSCQRIVTVFLCQSLISRVHLHRGASFYFAVSFGCKPQQWNSCPSFQFVRERWKKANSLKWNVPMLILLSPGELLILPGSRAIRSTREDLTAGPSVKYLGKLSNNCRKKLIICTRHFFYFC